MVKHFSMVQCLPVMKLVYNLSERDVAALQSVPTRGSVGCWIDPAWWTHPAISQSSQCSTTGNSKGYGICYPVCGMLLIGKSNPRGGGSGFHILLPEWFFIICLTPYNRTSKNVLSASLEFHPSSLSC